MATTIDELQVLITAQNKQFQAALRDVSKQLDGVGGDAQKANSKMSAGFEKIGSVATKALKITTVAAIAAITASIPGAVRRVDTLNNSARTFENMGFKTEIAEKAVKELERSITGLPTPLDSAMRGMTGLAATYGDIELGQQVFSSLNNAILGFGGSAAEVDNAITQLSQLPMDGPLDAQTWNSLRNSGLTPVLVAMSKEFGMSVSQMKEAFGDGTLTVEDFTTKLIEMNTKGGGGLKSLEKIAKDSTAGIGTGFANMRTAITRGVAVIIEAIGSKDIADALSSIGKGFESILRQIAEVISFVSSNKEIFAPLVAGIGAMVGVITAWYAATKLMIVAQTAFNLVLKLNPIGLIIVAVAGLVAGLVVLWNTSEGFRNFFIGMWGAITTALQPVVEAFRVHLLPILQTIWGFIVNQFKQAWDNLKQAFETVRKALQPYIEQMKGPLLTILQAVGIAIAVAVIAPLALLVVAITAVITIIGVIVGVIANLISWFAKMQAKAVELGSVMVGRVVNAFSTAWNNIRGIWSGAVSFFSGIVSGIGNAISGIPGRFKSTFQSAWNQITSIFKNLASWFSNINLADAGRKIVGSLIDGIKSMVGSAKQAASDVVQSVRDFFPFSPAKEGPFSGKGYTTYSGQALMQDFAESIQKQTPMLKKTMKSAMPDFNAQIDSSLDIPSGYDMSGSKPMHVTFMVGDEVLVDKIIDGINNKSFMTNSTIIQV